MNGDRINSQIMEYVLHELRRNARQIKYLTMVKLFLQLDECCNDPLHKVKHRVQPNAANDWRAVDNMMGIVLHNMCDHVGVTIEGLHERTDLLLSDDEDEEAFIKKLATQNVNLNVSKVFVNAQAIMLKEHYIILDEYDRVDGVIDADARNHYGLIIASIQQLEEQQEAKRNGNQKGEESRSADRCSVRRRSGDPSDTQRTH